MVFDIWWKSVKLQIKRNSTGSVTEGSRVQGKLGKKSRKTVPYSHFCFQLLSDDKSQKWTNIHIYFITSILKVEGTRYASGTM